MEHPFFLKKTIISCDCRLNEGHRMFMEIKEVSLLSEVVSCSFYGKYVGSKLCKDP